MRQFDVIVIGAGAAGMMCAAVAGQRGRSVLVLDHAEAPGKKIRISGGGRCNFTNIHSGPQAFLSGNPRFAISALKRYRPADFISLVERHGIAWHEKTLGQLFCDGSAQQIVDMLVREMNAAGAQMRLGTEVTGIERGADGFVLDAGGERLGCASLVIATGGKSIPKMGASGFAYKVAEQFGVRVTETRPALVPLTFEPGMLEKLRPLAGISVDAAVRCGKTVFEEALLFTHRGLSGPAILQISSYWREGQAIAIDLARGVDVRAAIGAARKEQGRQAVQTVLGELVSKKVAELLTDEAGVSGRVADLTAGQIDALVGAVKAWTVKPVGTEGYRTAEVTLGGVDTDALSSGDMQVKAVPGLYFIGEAVDVTGWLGGYNFQWAWASGRCAGQTA